MMILIDLKSIKDLDDPQKIKVARLVAKATTTEERKKALKKHGSEESCEILLATMSALFSNMNPWKKEEEKYLASLTEDSNI